MIKRIWTGIETKNKLVYYNNEGEKMKIIMEKDVFGNPFSNNDRLVVESIFSGIVSSFHSAALFLVDEPVLISNDPEADSPIFYSRIVNPRFVYNTVVLNCTNFLYWCQVIYQLSHELAHCTISRMNDGSRVNEVSWIEETICEATSLYCLKWFSENWTLISLSSLSPTFSISIKSYLDSCLERNGTNRLSCCKSVYELEEINRTSQMRREDRLNEMNLLYSLIRNDDLVALFSYRNYVLGGTVTMDTDAYSRAYQSVGAIQYLCSIQNKIYMN